MASTLPRVAATWRFHGAEFWFVHVVIHGVFVLSNLLSLDVSFMLDYINLIKSAFFEIYSR